MSYVTHHPAVLEHTLRWKDLSEEQQEALLADVRIQRITERLLSTFDVEMPTYFTIQFPVQRVNPQAPADALGSVQVLVEPRAPSTDAGSDSAAPEKQSASDTISE